MQFWKQHIKYEVMQIVTDSEKKKIVHRVSAMKCHVFMQHLPDKLAMVPWKEVVSLTYSAAFSRKYFWILNMVGPVWKDN